MLLKVRLSKEGVVGTDPKTGKTYIINTGISFTGVTEDKKKCSVISTNRVESLKHLGDNLIIVHGNEVLDNHVLIDPDPKWTLALI
ncbi:TPA: hypothetical protein R8G81_000967 [Citrobacter youngae]|nr:hypothetical protein [Citrobacter youngae]